MSTVHKTLLFTILVCLEAAFGFSSSSHGKYLNITDPELEEISGIDTAHRQDLAWWVINDSGNPNKLYGLNERGDMVVAIDMPFKNKDWEDLSSFIWQKQAWILIADVGDNRAKRKDVELYLFQEPKGSTSPQKQEIYRFKVHYRDGAQDVEAVAVDPANGWVYLLSKRKDIPELYRFPLDLSLAGNKLELEAQAKLIDIPQPTSEDLQQPYGAYRSQVTAMDFSTRHKTLAILTYKNAYLYRWSEPLLGQKLKLSQELICPDQKTLPQRESLCWNRDETGLIVVSEGIPTPIVEIKCTVKVENKAQP